MPVYKKVKKRTNKGNKGYELLRHPEGSKYWYKDLNQLPLHINDDRLLSQDCCHRSESSGDSTGINRGSK